GLLATVTSSGGGSGAYAPSLLNDGFIGECDNGTWGWVTSNGTYTYTWPTAQTFNKIVFYKANRPFTSMAAIEYSNNGGLSWTPIITNYSSLVTDCAPGVQYSRV